MGRTLEISYPSVYLTVEGHPKPGGLSITPTCFISSGPQISFGFPRGTTLPRRYIMAVFSPLVVGGFTCSHTQHLQFHRRPKSNMVTSVIHCVFKLQGCEVTEIREAETSAGTEISRILWNPDFNYVSQNVPPLDQPTPVHVILYSFRSILILFSSTRRSSKLSFSLGFPSKMLPAFIL